jgi:hypothetical protein
MLTPVGIFLERQFFVEVVSIETCVLNVNEQPTEERCDGGRNILHALVSQCQPTSNKDADQDAAQSSGQFSTGSWGFHTLGCCIVSYYFPEMYIRKIPYLPPPLTSLRRQNVKRETRKREKIWKKKA